MLVHDKIKGKKILLLIASEGFQPIEYSLTKDVLEEAGIQVVTVSDKPGGAMATDNSIVPLDGMLDELNVSKYDGFFLIGGNGAMASLDTEQVYAQLRQAAKKSIPFGAIGIATRILAKSQAIRGKQATGWNGDNALLAIYNANDVQFVDKEVVIHGLLVTAVGPTVAENFGKAIIRVLAKATLKNPGNPDDAVYYEIQED